MDNNTIQRLKQNFPFYMAWDPRWLQKVQELVWMERTQIEYMIRFPRMSIKFLFAQLKGSADFRDMLKKRIATLISLSNYLYRV